MFGVAAFFAMLVAGIALLVAAFGAFLWLLVHALVFLVVLPFRLLGWLFAIPFLLLKGLIVLVGGAVLMVGLAFVAVAVLGSLALAVLMPLIPLVVIGLGIWAFARLMRRPATA